MKTLTLLFVFLFVQLIGVRANITLIGFTAQQEGDIVSLQWKTGSENNNDFFTVERTSDGVNYSAVATIDGSGTTAQEITYNIHDTVASSGTHYYRLKQTNFDGSTQVVALQSIEITSGPDTFSVYPNPCSGNELKIRVAESGYYHIGISGANGQLVHAQDAAAASGGTIHVQLPVLEPGIYFVQATSNGNVDSQRIIVQ